MGVNKSSFLPILWLLVLDAISSADPDPGREAKSVQINADPVHFFIHLWLLRHEPRPACSLGVS
jgi:hypothetical protein